MKPFLLAIVSALAFMPLRAEPPKPAALTVGTRVFLDATVRPLDAFTARITHSAGTATLPAWELSAAQQKSFGFDPAATAAERAKRTEAARDAEAARQREARIVAAADAAVAAAAARATEREEQRARAERIAKADERAREKERYDRSRAESLLGMSSADMLTQSAAKCGTLQKSVHGPGGEKALVFKRGNLSVSVTILNQRVVSILYVRAPSFTFDEVEALLAENGGGWIRRTDVPGNCWESPLGIAKFFDGDNEVVKKGAGAVTVSLKPR